MISSRLPQIFYGGDYNPEQWSEEVWQQDMFLMKKAGVNLVSLGIFSWATLQPNEETYNFESMDKIIDLLQKNNIYIDLATATAAQPAWISLKYPDTLPVDEKGNKLSYGSRQSYCPNSPSYKRLSSNLVEAIANRYKNNTSVILWHINNEYACHTPTCYCDNCEKSFRTWLEKKYETINKLNESWGTNFWSQKYYNFEEIVLPKYTTAQNNPSQVLDYKRFMSDSILQLFLNEKEILERITPNIPITTNTLPYFKPLDWFKWANYMDVVSLDSYPNPEPNYHPYWAAFNHDLMRGLKNGKPFLLMEQAPSQVNWREINTNKRPGTMRLWSYQAIAHGSDSVMFFQWRQSLRGAEKYHSAMVTHSGDENSRIYREVEKLGNELKKLSDIVDSTIHAQVAIMFDYDNWWALEYKPGPSEKVNYPEVVSSYYKAFYELNIPIDIVSPSGDISKYKVVVAPPLHLIKAGVKENIENFVSNGGTFIATFFSGIVDENDGVFPGGYPGPLKEVLGITISEFDALETHMTNTIRLSSTFGNLRGDYNCSLWCDVVHTKKAEVIAYFRDDFYSNCPVVTKNTYNKGTAYYIATQPEDKFILDFLSEVCRSNNINSFIQVPYGVEVIIREKIDKQFIFILNHNNYNVSITLPKDSYTDLLSGLSGEKEFTLFSKDIKIFLVEK
jgi:beta-galactosidase